MDKASTVIPQDWVLMDIEPWLIAEVKALDYGRLEIEFADGLRATVVIPENLRKNRFPTLEMWPDCFVWQQGGSVAWPNHYDIGADYLRDVAERCDTGRK